MGNDLAEITLRGVRGAVEGIAADASTRVSKAIQTAATSAEKSVKTACDAQMHALEKKIEAAAAINSRGSLAWAAMGGATLLALALLLGVWLGSRGVTVSWLMTFGWHP